ncbi:MAG: hypothetical protein AMJ54_16355 [Deltaproteobacteria bacterium SG8_13]|nr:MAG: hypothetical protein AMJ54_16355 [Deltaproteobacteria bacterium SG8_13]
MQTSPFADNIVCRVLADDGTFPNNARLPLLLYPAAVILPDSDPARTFEDLFETNSWTNSWRNGIFGYHHYHSTAHEALGVCGGSARVQMGGPGGPEFDIRPADVIVIPAGVAHKNLESSGDFRVVGAYPAGQDWDMNFGKAGERPQADRNIADVACPEFDPVFGAAGPLARLWREIG